MNTMGKQIEQIDAQTLKSYFHDGGEVALLDAREEVPFDSRHIFMASCVPIGRLECLVDTLVPRRSVRVVWCDDGEGYAQLAAERMSSLGWSDIQVLGDRQGGGLWSRIVQEEARGRIGCCWQQCGPLWATQSGL